MIVVFEGRILSMPFVEMLDSKGVVKVRKVDVKSEIYEVAREYDPPRREDLEGERLKKLAKVAKIEPEAFKERFGYIVKSSGMLVQIIR